MERFVLEMALLATGGSLSEPQSRIAQRRDGAFQLLDLAANNYRRHLQFTNLALEVGGDPFRVAVPNIGQFRRHRTVLSDYCHFQVDPAETVNHPQRTWFIEGAARVKAVLDLLRSLRSQINGILRPESMPPEVP